MSQEKCIAISGQMHTMVKTQTVRVKDFVKIEGTDRTLVADVGHIEICQFREDEKQVVITLLYLMSCIHRHYPNLQIMNVGETEFILERMPQDATKGQRVLEVLRLSLVCVITFLGAAFTIMAFHNDISIGGVFERIYLQLIGRPKPAICEIEICYSLGLCAGILVFFNHFGKKKITPDPTPIQVEMRKYAKDIDSTFIENASRKGHCKDVD